MKKTFIYNLWIGSIYFLYIYMFYFKTLTSSNNEKDKYFIVILLIIFIYPLSIYINGIWQVYHSKWSKVLVY